MNVFVLCTGRCGSLAFAKACGHIKNYTSGHESRRSRIGFSRFDYPSNHIEVDNRLSWLLGRLEWYYGANSLYIHLKRDPDAVAASYAKRYDQGIMAAYHRGILLGVDEVSGVTPLDVAKDFVRTININIESFLRDKPSTMRIELERIDEMFPAFWDRIGAKGNLQGALAEFRRGHNASALCP